MRRNLPVLVGALCLAAAVGTAYYLGLNRQQKAATPSPAVVTPVRVAVDPTENERELTLRTGDHFWGLHLDGVVPCAGVIVKGGGHLVIMSPKGDYEAKCYYHVRGEKVVHLGGRKFRLSVTAPDQIRVRMVDEADPTATAVAPVNSLATEASAGVLGLIPTEDTAQPMLARPGNGE